MNRLERAGYVDVYKTFRGKLPYTEYALTLVGREALDEYWAALDQVRATNGVGRK